MDPNGAREPWLHPKTLQEEKMALTNAQGEVLYGRAKLEIRGVGKAPLKPSDLAPDTAMSPFSLCATVHSCESECLQPAGQPLGRSRCTACSRR